MKQSREFKIGDKVRINIDIEEFPYQTKFNGLCTKICYIENIFVNYKYILELNVARGLYFSSDELIFISPDNNIRCRKVKKNNE